MLILLPIFSFFFLLWTIKRIVSIDGNPLAVHDWRYHGILAAVIIGVLVVVMTEILSVFYLLTFTGVSAAWSLTFLVVLFFWFTHGRNFQITFQFSNLPKVLLIPMTSVAAIVLTIGMVAILSPPNTWDSMTYHMSRVAHWIQNHNVRHYPTNILRQLYHAPWTEFAIMHFQILSGGDRFANLVQWFLYIGSMLGVSLIGKQLGLNVWGQVFSFVFAATVPMAILQASSTQSDLAASFWLITAVSFLLQLQKKFSWRDGFGAGASLGLAFLSKAVSYAYVFPFVVWSVWIYLKNKSLRGQLIKVGFVVSLLVFSINGGYFVRNYQLFHQPFGPVQTINLTNEEFGLRPFISNLIRNAASHACVPAVKVNHALTKWIYLLHYKLGMDPNNPKTTYAPNVGKFEVRPIHAHEDSASNPVHFWLIVVSIFAYLSLKKNRRSQVVSAYILTIVSAFLLLCLCFKWQVWISRLQLPLFLLWAPAVGYLLSEMKRKWLIGLVMGGLLLTSFYYALFNFSRSLLKFPFRDDLPPTIFESNRELLYLNNGAQIVKLSYLLALKYIQSKGYRNVGLLISEDDWEYPYWAVLKSSNPSIRIEHIEISNVSAGIGRKPFVPDVVVATKPTEEQISRYEREIGTVRKMGILWVFGK